MSKELFLWPWTVSSNVIKIFFLFANQDMVTAIIAESTLDCTVGTEQLLLATPYKAATPNMGALRMELKRGERP